MRAIPAGSAHTDVARRAVAMSATAIPAKLLHQEKLTAAAKDQCVTLERQVAVQKEARVIGGGVPSSSRPK